MRSVLEGVQETLFRNQTAANTYTKELFEEAFKPMVEKGKKWEASYWERSCADNRGIFEGHAHFPEFEESN